ncbi:MAG: septum formation initiator family protein [Agathobacter sp.]|nr:septum formation initiator family protein [Agathobacter sp.]
MSVKRNGRRSSGVVSISLIVIAFAAVMSVQIFRLKQKDREYAERERELLQESEDEMLRSSQLDELGRTIDSTEYIESVARSKLGLTKDKDNEIIFKEQRE